MTPIPWLQILGQLNSSITAEREEVIILKTTVTKFIPNSHYETYRKYADAGVPANGFLLNHTYAETFQGTQPHRTCEGHKAEYIICAGNDILGN